MEWLSSYPAALLANVVDPQKRLFAGYLLSALLIALVWGAARTGGDWRRGARAVCATLFCKRLWWSRSARADYKLLVANQAVLMVLAPLLVSRVALTTWLFLVFHEWFGTPSSSLSAVPVWSVIVAFTVFQFVVDDASRYLVHRALHRFRSLWAFHKVHHSATSLTPFTVLRTHPVEAVLFSMRAAVTQALAVALFVYLFGDKVDLLSVFGVQVFLFCFNALGSNLRHTPVPVAYPSGVERWLISPAQHQVHHSTAPCHHDRNFGAVLAVWDRLGGTLCVADSGQSLKFGLPQTCPREQHSLLSLYFGPFAATLPVARRAVDCLRRTFSMFMRTVTLHRPGRRPGLLANVLVVALAVWPALIQAADEINIYSHRQPFLIEPFLDAFEAETGIQTNVVFASKGLAQRLQAEGERSPADVVLTVDIGRLHVYADKDLLAPIDSAVLQRNIPSHLRDPENRWFGFSTRARVVAYSRSRVDAGQIQRIEDLADPKWKGRICSRPGSHVYNRALLSSIIAANGEAAAESWARGLVENLAQRPQGNDRAQIKAIYEGVCDIALVNSYYYGKVKNSEIPEQRAWVEDMGIVFTNQQDRGNHVNISGGGIAKYSNNKAAATAFLEFLTQAQAQVLYGEVNYEFPVNPAVSAGEEVGSWGAFEADQLSISDIALLSPEAQRIIDRVGW